MSESRRDIQASIDLAQKCGMLPTPLSLAERTDRDHAWKQAVTNDFLRGDSIATIANRCACHKLRVEQVLREAITGLAALKASTNEAQST